MQMDDFDKLLNPGLEDEDQDAVQETAGTPKPTDVDLKAEMESSKQQLADLQEKIRQLSEENKDYREFKERLVGNPDEEKKKREALEREREFDKDPIGFMEKEISTLREGIFRENHKKTVNKALLEVRRDYSIDYDKEYPKIMKELKNFSESAKKEDPKGALLRACRLAGVLKKRKKSAPNAITSEGGINTPPGAAAAMTEAERIKKRLIGKVKKSNNVFGI